MKKLLLLTTLLFPIAAFAGNNTNNGVGNNIEDNTYNSSSKTYNDNYNKNTNINKQFQVQGQYQGQDASVSNDIAYSNRFAVSSAFAAPLVAGGESCMGSTSIGGQGFSFGLSAGSTWHDESCERRKDSITIYNMGEKRAALALMCQEENVRNAMLAAGRYCPTSETVESAKKFSSGNAVTKSGDLFPQQPRH